MRNSIVAISLFIVLAGVGFGQTQSASISGTVTDPAGAAVPGAKITITNTDTQVSRVAESNETGTYVVPNLLPGPYRIEVSKEGFQKAVSTVTLAVNQRATLEIALEVGAVSQTVQVSAEAAGLEANAAQVGTVVSEEKIVDLPLNARNFTQLLTLTPGAGPVSVAQNSGGGRTQNVGIRVYPAVDGQSNRSNSFLLDGVYNNSDIFSTYAIAPSVDALSQFKVQSHSDQAEFGGVTGGVVNIVSKSGTNRFHGTAYEFVRNDAFDARGFFTTAKPPLRQNQFGATLGGPVRHDKTFFFFSYEGYRRKQPASSLSLIPTPEQLTGDFSLLSRAIYNPFSTRADPANPNGFLRDPFPENKIPPNLINKSTQAWGQTIIPRPVATGVAGFNYRNDRPQTAPLDQYSFRVDHNFSPSDFLWARYTTDTQNQVNASVYESTYNAVDNHARNAGLSYTHLFSNSTLFNFLFGYAGLGQERFSFLTDTNLFDKGFFAGFPPLPTKAPAPTIFGASNNKATDGPNEAYQFRGDLSHLRGRHSLKFGIEWIRVLNHNYDVDDSLGFDSRQTANLSNLSATGYDMASFVLGAINSWSFKINTYEYNMDLPSFYVQDSWRVTDRLTVNYGLRWDMATYPIFTDNFPSTWDFTNGKFVVGSKPLPACSGSKPPCLPDPNDPYVQKYVVFNGSSRIRHNDFRMLGPRLGVAYRLGQTMVVRSSFGIHWDKEAGVMQQAQNGPGVWPYPTSISRSNLNQTFIDVTADNPFGTGTDPRLPTVNPANAQGYFYDPNFQYPYSEQWNAEIQKELPNSLSLTLGYVGSHNLRLPIGGSYNTALAPGPGPIPPRALFPFAPVSNYDRSIAQSSYHGLLFKAEQRFSKGLSYLVSYTWSKAMDVASSGQFGVESESLQNPYDPNSSRSVSGFDITHVFSTALVYELPFGHGKRWVTSGAAARVLGNWQTNAIVLLRSGQPYTLLTNVDSANIGALGGANRTRPNLTGNPGLPHPRPEMWFNAGAFAPPAPFTFGNLGRNSLRSQAYQDVDLSLFREDRITERIRTQFRAESFNIFNHPTFGIPQTSFISPLFGHISGTASTARQLQLGFKVIF
jgi:outer membrane receptor protein involved in Fe transport